MKVLFIAFVVGVVAADVSHLGGPSKSYLPPSVGGQQGISQFGGGLGQQMPSNQYLAPRGGGGFDVNSQAGFGTGQIQTPSNQYLGPNQGSSSIGSSSLGSVSPGSQSYQRGGGGGVNQYSNQFQSSQAGHGQLNDVVPGHTLGEDGYKYRSPNF